MTTVKAEVHSDDYVFEVAFNATDYIASLSDNELRVLHGIGWGGDYEADAVARYYEDLNLEVTALFTYLDKKRGLRDAPGFGRIGPRCMRSFRMEADMALFELGQTPGTAAVVIMLEEAGVTTQSLLERHHLGFWGDVYEDNWQANERALVEGNRLFSVYKVREKKVYVITEADRSATTIMLAEEY